jgi:hypothetical protein
MAGGIMYLSLHRAARDWGTVGRWGSICGLPSPPPPPERVVGVDWLICTSCNTLQHRPRWPTLASSLPLSPSCPQQVRSSILEAQQQVPQSLQQQLLGATSLPAPSASGAGASAVPPEAGPSQPAHAGHDGATTSSGHTATVGEGQSTIIHEAPPHLKLQYSGRDVVGTRAQPDIGGGVLLQLQENSGSGTVAVNEPANGGYGHHHAVADPLLG